MPDISGYSNYDGLGLAELVRNGEVTAGELLENALAGIEALNPKLNGVTARLDDRARAEIAAGLADGPFTGVPFVLKELGIQCQGAPSRCGSKLTEDLVAVADSEGSGPHPRRLERGIGRDGGGRCIAAGARE